MLSLPLTPFSSLPSYSSTQATLHYTTLHCTNHTIFSTGMKGGIPVFIEKLHSAFPLFHQKVFGSFSTAHPKIDKKKDVLVSWISNAALQPGGVYLTLPYLTIPYHTIPYHHWCIFLHSRSSSFSYVPSSVKFLLLLQLLILHVWYTHTYCFYCSLASTCILTHILTNFILLITTDRAPSQ